MIYKNTLFPLKQEQTKLKFYYVSEKKKNHLSLISKVILS